MSATDDLVRLLKKLRLSGVLQSLELRTKQEVDDNLALTEFLYRLLADEVVRDNRPGSPLGDPGLSSLMRPVGRPRCITLTSKSTKECRTCASRARAR
jgi:hypothetical protein